MTSRKYSDYYEKNVQGRYRFKLGLVGQIHTLLNLILIAQLLCLRLSLINTPSPEELKAYKSLKGYKYLIVGWVEPTQQPLATCLCILPHLKAVLTATVRHYQAVAAEKLDCLCGHMKWRYVFFSWWKRPLVLNYYTSSL